MVMVVILIKNPLIRPAMSFVGGNVALPGPLGSSSGYVVINNHG